ncbi:MAG: LysM peptidoglycan-binding domain-containing protein [Oscillospiraceae bacterium]|nr:LysM peptidoglycan-binding domain-containing protein [Oscillospiraceae bacterium]
MKKTKRILISLCVAATLISCFGAFAYADGDGYTTYTIKAGDTVLKVCQSLGIDFYANQAWITSVNNIGNYNNIKVGKVLYLPTFNTTTDPTKAINVKNSLSGTTTTTATTPTTTTVATTTQTAAVATTTAGDAIVSYLIYHKLQAGETVGSVCAALGVDFDSNADRIKQLSGITNYYHIPVGQNIVIPSLTVPAGSSYTAIVAHKVKGGETVGSICNSYGLDFAKVQAQLKALNNTDNLNRINVGQNFYLPVAGATIATNATTPSTTTGTTTPASTPVTQVYQLNKQASAHGSFKLQVGGKDVSSVAAGTNVNIVATPDSGYKVYTVTVMKTGGEQAVAVNSMSFTMPAYDVTVSVTFKSY